MELQNVYTLEGIFIDRNKDGLFDGIKGKIYIPEESSIEEKLVALNLLGRLSYECSAMSIDNISFFNNLEDIPKNSIVIYIDENSDLELDETMIKIEDECIYIVAKDKESLKIGGKYFYSRMPYIFNVGKNEPTLTDLVKKLESLNIENPNIKEIIISKDYKGIKKIFLGGKFSDLDQSQLNDFDMVKSIEFNSEIIINNENFKEIPHEENDDEDFKDLKMELSDLFSIKGIYSDTEDDLMNNSLDIKIAIDENISNTLVKAVGNIVVRAAVDSLDLKFNLVKTFKNCRSKNIIKVFASNSEPEISLDKENRSLIISGEEEGILKLSENLVTQYPYTDINKNIPIEELLRHFEDVLKGKNYQGQLAFLEENLKEKDSIKLYGNLSGIDSVEENINYLKEKYPNKTFEILNHKENQIIWTETFEPKWEVEVFEDIIKDEVLKNLNSGDELEIYGCLSEEKEIREKLSKRIEDSILDIGGKIKSLNIFSTYKQGFSWITEKVIPEIKDLKNIEKIIIKFKPFLPEGQKDWLDESGSTPQYQELKDEEDRWLDLPIRFLQELYPVDDIISKEIGINRDNIFFEADDTLEETYEIICINDNKEVYRDTGITKVSERPFLNEFPEHGKVHPTTGWIKVLINGELKVDKRIKTDLENIWDFYQEKVLEKAKSYVLEKGNGKVLTEKQPFFTEIKMDIEVSDIDYKLPFRNDLISSLDAFHEDIYFVGQDFFKFLGIKYSSEPASEPGLILPVIKKTLGKGPKVVATITNNLYDEPTLFIDDLEEKLLKPSENLKIESISYKNDSLQLNIILEYKDFRLISNYVEMINSKSLKDIISESVFNIKFKNELTLEEITIYKNSDLKKSKKKKLDPSKIKTDELIGYHDYINLMNELKDIEGIKSYVASKSYEGRDVYVVDFFDEDLNDYVSRIKLINSKPVCFINSRHHANEVSSTNAAFDLIVSLKTDEAYKKYLDKLNIVIIPFENPDGGHIHYELQKENPEWKFHVARFNALGKEIANEWFKFDTIHTEALAYTKTWFKWLPDIVTDNHGVPSHEWDQQFSGYVSPSFKGFWLPRALYYGYFWYITNEEYTKNNVGIGEIIQDKLSDLINSDSEMEMWNRDWADRFEKYAHEWMPKLFPADYYKNLIYYWIPFDIEKTKKYPSHFYPKVTSLDWTTEVADETATGDYLELCAKAHIKGCLAVMESMISIKNIPENLDSEVNGTVRLNRKRIRPLHI